MPLVAGVDSSTQSVKVVVRDAETGDLVREGRSIHPEGTEVHPDHWWAALEEASAGLLDGVEAMSVAAQQHGMVALDDAGEVVRKLAVAEALSTVSQERDTLANQLNQQRSQSAVVLQANLLDEAGWPALFAAVKTSFNRQSRGSFRISVSPARFGTVRERVIDVLGS